MPISYRTPGPRLRSVFLIPATLAIAACASPPEPPTSSLEAARQAIASAERSDAARHAPAELNEARARIAAAEAEVNAKRMVTAGWLADESRAHAEFASAKSGAEKANAVNEEMKRSTSTLIQEMERSTGDRR